MAEPLPETAEVKPLVVEPQAQPSEEQETEVYGEETKRVPDLLVNSRLEDHPNDHRILTIITMILCGAILNVFAFFCLIPAFIFSKKVSVPLCTSHY